MTKCAFISSLPEAMRATFYSGSIESILKYENTGVVLLHKAMLKWCNTCQLCNFCSSLVGQKHPLVSSPDIYLYTYMQINHSHKLRGHTNHVENDQLQIQSRHRQGGDEHEVDTHRQIINI